MTMQLITTELGGELHLFHLEGLLPADQVLVVHTTDLILSLVSTHSQNDNPILLQRVLTQTDMRILLSLLRYPSCCPYDIVRASLFCSYNGLLAGLFSKGSEWQATVDESRLLLQRAKANGTWRKELMPLYKALSHLRSNLHPFGLTVSGSLSYLGYALISLPLSQQQKGDAGHDYRPLYVGS